MYTLFLIPVTMLPWALPLHGPMVGNVAMVIAVVGGLVFAYFAFRLYQECTIEAARKVMFASFFHLPVVQIAYVLNPM
jgi:protoheme IX farnesyltransferase